MTTPQTFTTQLCHDGWYVLREDGTTLAIVPDTDVLGKWAAEEITRLMNRREIACAELQAADAALKRLTRFGGAVVIDGDSIDFVAGGQVEAQPLASHHGNFVAALAKLEVPA